MLSRFRNYGFNFNGIPLDRKFGWISASSGAAVLCNMKQKFCFEIFWLTKVVSEKLIFFSNGSFFLVSIEAFLNSIYDPILSPIFGCYPAQNSKMERTLILYDVLVCRLTFQTIFHDFSQVLNSFTIKDLVACWLSKICST